MLGKSGKLTIVSTRKALDAIGYDHLKRWLVDRAVYVLRESARAGEASPIALHAKLVAWESGKSKVTLIGSANATGRGFGLKKQTRSKNAEAMIRLSPGVSLDAFTRDFVQQPWVTRYERNPGPVPDGPDEVLARQLSRLVSMVGLSGKFRAEGQLLTIKAVLANEPPGLVETIRCTRVAPFFAADEDSRPLHDALGVGGATFVVPVARLSRFVRLVAISGLSTEERIVTMDLPLDSQRDIEARKLVLARANPVALVQAAIGRSAARNSTPGGGGSLAERRKEPKRTATWKHGSAASLAYPLSRKFSRPV